MGGCVFVFGLVAEEREVWFVAEGGFCRVLFLFSFLMHTIFLRGVFFLFGQQLGVGSRGMLSGYYICGRPRDSRTYARRVTVTGKQLQEVFK